jgi:hypothetical protein
MDEALDRFTKAFNGPGFVWFMVFNATFDNISAILWLSGLLVG